MKLEKRENTVFVSHGGLTVFFNALKNRETGEKFYSINVNQNTGDRANSKWETVGQMTVNPDLFNELALGLASL